MSPWPRYAAGILLALSLALSGTAKAQSNPAERADQLNDQGKKLFGEQDYAGAAQKFRQAILFSPEGRFYFNLCWTLTQMGQYREAMTACEAVAPNGASNPLKEKTKKVMAQIRAKLKSSGGTGSSGTGDTGSSGTGDTSGTGGGTGSSGTGGTGDAGAGTGDAGGTGDPGYTDTSYTGDTGTTGDTGAGTGDAGGTDSSGTGQTGDSGAATGAPPPPPPDTQIEQPPPPSNDYKWSWGVGIGGLNNNVGAEGNYSESGGQFRANVNFLVAQSLNMGIQGYLHLSTFGEADMANSLEIFDLGAALYQHRGISNNFFWTWLGGAQLALIRPESLTSGSSLVAPALRGEVSVGWLLGSKHQHALSLSAGLNIYLPASEGGGQDPAVFGLDEAGVTAGLSVGYTMRFTTPFGQTPIITLE